MYGDRSLASVHAGWACMVGEGRRLREPEFRTEALRYARMMMGRAREGLERIVDRRDGLRRGLSRCER